jgi:biotin operon repressor
MANKQHLTLQLSKNVKLERSNKFYAEKLELSEADVLEMIKELKPKQYKKIK